MYADASNVKPGAKTARTPLQVYRLAMVVALHNMRWRTIQFPRTTSIL